MEKKLKKLGFKKKVNKVYEDLKWSEKKIKHKSIKLKAIWDGRFGTIDVKIYKETCSKSSRQWESIYVTRDFSKFIKKVKKYDK